LSFHPVKAITTGEGGAVVSSDKDVAEKVARFRTHGIEREPPKLHVNEGPWWHEMHDLGFNYRLTDIQSVLGTSQLRRLESFVARRREIAAMYDERLADLSQIQLPVVREGVEPAWHLYVIRTRDTSRRRAFFDRLRALQLGVQVHYIPAHYHPYYQSLGFRRGQFPNAEAFYAGAVSIPIFPELTDEDVESSVDRIRRAAQDTL
jgi:dTDP-4-amino-4,6-dideoxygalactose transaminase